MPNQQEPESSQSISKAQFRPKSHKKRRSISIRKPNQDQDSSDFDQSMCLQQNKPLLDYYNQKCCQICISTSDESQIYFCDKCDDGYHIYCLQNNQHKPSTNFWICPKCIKEQRQAKALINTKPIKIIEEKSSNCHQCNKKLEQKKMQEIYFGNPPQKMMYEFEQETKKCSYCQKLFHQDCFNKRNAALNCTKCQRSIRNRCPKGHFKFVEYYRKKFEVFKMEKYLTLQPLDKQLWPSKHERKRYPKIGFKIPIPVTNWQLITQYEASIYYAFETKNLNFIEDQIYDDPKVMDLNRWNRDCVPIYQLNEDDQRVFEMFKENTRNGVIVGPYEIKEDTVKGFHIVATDFIQKMTIITEYVGEVVSARKSLFHHKKNDSIFMLIKNSRSLFSLDIVPHHFGNIARFFSGINNRSREGKRLLNVEAMRFSYQGRMRIIFYAKKNIQAGDELFFDYNGSPFHEYPTDNFKH